MLMFIDKPKNLRLVRATVDASGSHRRELIGVVAKNDLTLPDTLSESLTADEMKQAEEMLDLHREAGMVAGRAAALNLPNTMRDVLNYLDFGAATPMERHHVMTTLLESLRLLRKSDRADQE